MVIRPFSLLDVASREGVIDIVVEEVLVGIIRRTVPGTKR